MTTAILFTIYTGLLIAALAVFMWPVAIICCVIRDNIRHKKSARRYFHDLHSRTRNTLR